MTDQSQRRKQAAQKAIHTKKRKVRAEVAVLLNQFWTYPPPDLPELVEQVVSRLIERYGHDHVTERAIVSFARHRLTSYHAILKLVRGKPGAADIRLKVKVYLSVQIIQTYGLAIDPLIATDVSRERAARLFVAGLFDEFQV